MVPTGGKWLRPNWNLVRRDDILAVSFWVPLLIYIPRTTGWSCWLENSQHSWIIEYQLFIAIADVEPIEPVWVYMHFFIICVENLKLHWRFTTMGVVRRIWICIKIVGCVWGTKLAINRRWVLYHVPDGQLLRTGTQGRRSLIPGFHRLVSWEFLLWSLMVPLPLVRRISLITLSDRRKMKESGVSDRWIIMLIQMCEDLTTVYTDKNKQWGWKCMMNWGWLYRCSTGRYAGGVKVTFHHEAEGEPMSKFIFP